MPSVSLWFTLFRTTGTQKAWDVAFVVEVWPNREDRHVPICRVCDLPLFVDVRPVRRDSC